MMIGPFKLISLIGKGSTSQVFVGERVEKFVQRVAIKILNEDLCSEEPRLLSSFDHPNIVRLLDQGISETGCFFLALEYVEGLPLDQFCDHSRLSISDRLRLLQKVMSGVSYAHRHLVVHADLKPSNILVDVAGEPKVLDFGIARVLNAGADSDHNYLTPDYASPEQLTGRTATVASDVYSLGVLASLLVTGVLPSSGDAGSPHPATGPMGKLHEAQMRAIAHARSTSPAGLRRALSGDLDAILAKSLNIDPDQRYSSVALFSEDILAHLEQRIISARPTTLSQRLGKWIGRNRVLAGVAGALTLAILITATGIVVQTARAEYQRRIAQDRLHELVRLTATLDGDLYLSLGPLVGADKARQDLLHGTAQALDELATSSASDSTLTVELSQQYETLAKLQRAASTASPGGRIEALSNVEKAVALLARLPRRRAQDSDVMQRIQELSVLRSSLESGRVN